MNKENPGDSPSDKERPSTNRIIYAYPPGDWEKSEDSVSVKEMWGVIWQGKWVIAALVAIFSFLAVALAISLPNIYRAEAVLAPSEEAEGAGLASMAGRLGGLASLAGIDLAAGDGPDKVAIALEVLESRAFVAGFIERHELLPVVMAVESWNPATDQLVFDSNIYDFEHKKWVRQVDPPKTAKPSDWEAYSIFMNMLVVSRDNETGFVAIAFDHYSPTVAKKMVELLVYDLNQFMKNQDVLEAQRSVDYLKEQAATVNIADMRTVFYQLIEDQIQTMMLAEVRDQYIFRAIDPAVVPEEKIRPKRALIAVIGSFLGFFIGIFVILFRRFSLDQQK